MNRKRGNRGRPGSESGHVSYIFGHYIFILHEIFAAKGFQLIDDTNNKKYKTEIDFPAV